jgi:hypothetical protein
MSKFFLLGSFIRPASTLFFDLLTLYWRIRIVYLSPTPRCFILCIISCVSSLILLFSYFRSRYLAPRLCCSPVRRLRSGCSLTACRIALLCFYYSVMVRVVLACLAPRKTYLPVWFFFFCPLPGSSRRGRGFLLCCVAPARRCRFL